MADEPSVPVFEDCTNYECRNPDCGKWSRYTGVHDYHSTGKPREPAVCPLCKVPAYKVDPDSGERWRLTWEMVGPFDLDWHEQTAEHTSEKRAQDQFDGLHELMAAGELIRNVRMERAEIVWVPQGGRDGEA